MNGFRILKGFVWSWVYLYIPSAILVEIGDLIGFSERTDFQRQLLRIAAGVAMLAWWTLMDRLFKGRDDDEVETPPWQRPGAGGAK